MNPPSSARSFPISINQPSSSSSSVDRVVDEGRKAAMKRHYEPLFKVTVVAARRIPTIFGGVAVAEQHFAACRVQN